MSEVSIILPARNEEANISNCINSIIAQTYTDWKLIVIDDGSTDKTAARVEEFLCDRRMTLIRNENSIVLAASLNKGIALSASKYICRMDADDLMAPKRLEHQINFISENPEVSILGTAAVYHSSGKYRLVEMPSIKPQDELKKGRVPVIHPTVLFNYHNLGGDLVYNEDSLRAEDLDLWYSLRDKYIFANINYPSIIYNEVPKNFLRTVLDNWRVKLKYLGFFPALKATLILTLYLTKEVLKK